MLWVSTGPWVQVSVSNLMAGLARYDYQELFERGLALYTEAHISIAQVICTNLGVYKSSSI